MTQEDKAKRYDDILVKLQKAKTDNNVCDDRYCCVIDDIVPELKESEDEKIRKALKQYFVNSFQNNGVAAICGVHVKDILAWLEKQGEQKPAWKPTENQMASIKQAVVNMKASPCYDSELVSLYNDLNAL